MKRLLLFVAFACLSPSGECRTLSQLQSDTRILILDASSTRQRFSDATITNLLNQGQHEAIARTRCIEKAHNFTLSAGSTYYSLPSDYLAVRRVTRDSLALTELSPAALDGRSRGWETSSGIPTYYFINFSSRGMIGFAPFPMVNTDTATIKVEYFADAADMSAASDTPFNGINEFVDYHQILSYYAATRLTMIDGRVNLSSGYAQIYENMLKAMAENCKMRPNYLPSAVAVP